MKNYRPQVLLRSFSLLKETNMYIIQTESAFDAAHFLKDYQGKYVNRVNQIDDHENGGIE